MKPEEKLQHEIVKFHSHRWPERHGMLFEVNNDTQGMKQAMHRRSMGMVSGAADLIMIHNGTIAGIEVKAPGSRHNPDHIRNQIEWGHQLGANWGWYLISSDENKIKAFMCALVGGNENIMADICNSENGKVREQLNSGQKTIGF